MFESRKELREKVETLTNELRQSRNDAEFWKHLSHYNSDAFDHMVREYRKLLRENNRINKCLDNAIGRGDDYRDEYEKLKKENEVLNKTLEDTNENTDYWKQKFFNTSHSFELLRKENENLKNRPLYMNEVWGYICDAHKANETIRELEKEVALLQDKLRKIENIVEE